MLNALTRERKRFSKIHRLTWLVADRGNRRRLHLAHKAPMVKEATNFYKRLLVGTALPYTGSDIRCLLRFRVALYQPGDAEWSSTVVGITSFFICLLFYTCTFILVILNKLWIRFKKFQILHQNRKFYADQKFQFHFYYGIMSTTTIAAVHIVFFTLVRGVSSRVPWFESRVQYLFLFPKLFTQSNSLNMGPL